ncbi:hypothetical protein K4K56_010206 [Colletotrichum sp. SAR 10_98]|nr:hypothetical protein K4K56_010206 [Colletotrichum sp. SAR 10_98]
MNAQMRRIDLLCKLLGPLSIALIDGVSTETAIIFNFTMNVSSVVIEYHAIARVYYEVPALQANKCDGHSHDLTAVRLPRASAGRLNGLGQRLKFIAKKSVDDMRLYVRHRAFLPSFAGALLYLTVLSFGGQMVTYLLSIGYSATEIGIARTLSVAFEVLATWVAPRLMELIGPIIVQEDVEAENRGAFSSVEAAWQNAFELLSYASTIAFFRPEQFRWPSLLSVAAVATASAAYTLFVYLRRGHLLHLNALGAVEPEDIDNGKWLAASYNIHSVVNKRNIILEALIHDRVIDGIRGYERSKDI